MLDAALQEAARTAGIVVGGRRWRHLHRGVTRSMERRVLGRTGMKVSAVSFGAWAIGSSWGPVDDNESMAALHTAIDAGVNFVDTADVYGDGKSERLVARLKRERPGEEIYVATKAGRRLPSQTADGYTRENLIAWIERSLRNLETDAIDLLQLHCPHPDVYDRPDVFGTSTIWLPPERFATTG